MKIVISNTDHTVDVEIADDTKDWDCHEVAALARDLWRETKTPTHRVGFELKET